MLLLSITSAMTIAACDTQHKPAESVGQRTDKPIERTNSRATAAGEKVGAQMDRSETNMSNAASSVAADANSTSARPGDTLADGAITTSINADLLKDPELSVLKIDVDTKQGVVVLNGLTPSETARVRAAKLAAAVKGVSRVENNLSVKKQ